MEVTRRKFIIGLGGVGLGFGLGGLSHLFPLESPQVGPDWSPGAEGFVPSTCLLCPSHCGILGRVVDGRLVRIDGNPIHPISRGGLCPKGRAGLQLLYHPARLKGPLERRGAPGSESFVPIAWDAALERVAEVLRSLRSSGRPEAMAWLVGDVDGAMSEVIDRFLQVCGSPHLVRESYADGSSEVMALSQGIRADPALDLERAHLVVSFGAALSEAWWCLPQVARARDLPPEQRCRWIQIDTRLSRTAVAADRWIPVHADNYGLLALSIAYVLLKEGLYDPEWVRDRLTGFEDWTDAEGRQVPGYRSLVLRYGSPEEVSERIGVPIQEIVSLAKEFGRSRRPLAVWDQTVTWRRGGLSDALAIHALNVLCGSVERPGGVYVQPPLPPQFAKAIPRASVAGAGALVSPLGDADWADRVLEGGSPAVEALFMYRVNPAASSPAQEKVREALARIPLVVSFSPFLDESARYAHLVLPDHTYLERWQDAPAPACVPYPVWGVVQPLVPPLHDTRATGDVVLDLASRVGDGVASAFPWSTMQDLVQARGMALAEAHRGSTFVPGFRREEIREMEARGWWVPHGQGPGSFWESIRASGGWFDPYHEDRSQAAASRRPDGRCALFPEEARRRISAAVPGLPEGFLPIYEPGTTPERGREGIEGARRLRLMPYRVMTLASGMTPLMPWLLENLGPLTGSAWEPWVEIHPETAREWDVHAGQKVRVVSEHGAFMARLCVFQGAQPGVLNAPYGLHSSVDGWEPFEPSNPLAAVGPTRDPVTGLPDWYSTHVRIEAV